MRKYSTAAVWTGALMLIAFALLIFEEDLLWKEQETSLFLHTPLFFREQMVVPGGLLTWAGLFFTQLFYHPIVGVIALSGWWLLLMWLVKRTFRISSHWAVLTLIPVALLLLTLVDKGYWIYFLKLHGLIFIATIGTTAVVALLWLFRLLPSRSWQRTMFIILVCAVGYPLMGIYGLAASLLMALLSWRIGTGQGEAIVNSIVAVLSVIAVPLLCYRYVYYQTNLSNIYFAELPLYFITEEYHNYYIPFYLLALYFVALIMWTERRGGNNEERQQVMALQTARRGAGTSVSKKDKKKGNRKDTKKKNRIDWKPLFKAAMPACVGLAIMGGLAWFWYKDENFHRELAMQHRIDQHDWEGVLKEANLQEEEPTRAIVMMKNLALARLGRQGNEMYLYKNGAKAYNAPFGMRLMLAIGPMIYYQYGMLNYCNRLCMETGVEFGFSPEYLKLMAKCAILNGEEKAARKYIKLLKHTLWHSQWAVQAETLLSQPELIAKDPEMEPITHMMHYSNTLNSDQGFVERFLMNQLARNNYKDDPIFQEQALLATLWTKDIGMFWQRFYDYIRLHPNSPIPRYYQEAAYLYGKLEERENLDKMPFDESVKSGFDRFMQVATKYDGADIETVRNALSPAFGQTYFFDFYAMSQLPEY